MEIKKDVDYLLTGLERTLAYLIEQVTLRLDELEKKEEAVKRSILLEMEEDIEDIYSK